MYFTGIIIAIMTFLTIGIWHPIVIKTEYYWGTKPWVIAEHFFLPHFSKEQEKLLQADREYLSLLIPGRVWCLSTLGHRRAVFSEETCRERLVP